MTSVQDYLKLHFLVFLWGFTAILGKLITIPAVEMVFLRTLLAALGMGVLIVSGMSTFKASRRDIVIATATGLIVAVHWLTFFLSGRVSNPSTSLVGFATCSLWAALLEPIVKKKRISILEVGLGCMVVGGLYVIFSFNFQYPLGLVLGILSGLTLAIFGVINSLLVQRMSSYTITFYNMTGATIGILLFFPFYTAFFASNGRLDFDATLLDWVWILILALVCSVYAYTVGINLMKRVSVFFFQLTLNLEPVYGIILALLIFGEAEVMGATFYAGTAIILLAVLVYPALRKKQ